MTIASATMGMDDFRRYALPRVADALAGGVAASLPWSTSVTGILIALWLLATLPTLSVGAVRREILSASGGLPVLFAICAAAGMAWADVPTVAPARLSQMVITRANMPPGAAAVVR